MRLLAIDPGPVESALVLYDVDRGVPTKWVQQLNELGWPAWMAGASVLAVEMVASYGMPVGRETFETVLWTGRFVERWERRQLGAAVLMYRRDVKLHLCGTQRASDANVRQALTDRFGPGRSRAVGTKKAPGPLHGMKADAWQALAVAVTAAECSVQGVAA